MTIGQLTMQKLHNLQCTFDLTTAQIVINSTLNYTLGVILETMQQRDSMSASWRIHSDRDRLSRSLTRNSFVIMWKSFH